MRNIDSCQVLSIIAGWLRTLFLIRLRSNITVSPGFFTPVPCGVFWSISEYAKILKNA